MNGKPLVIAWRQYQPNPGIKEARARLVRHLLEAGVPVYEGLDGAVRALAKVSGYYAFQKAQR